jgi:hypothetical protein
MVETVVAVYRVTVMAEPAAKVERIVFTDVEEYTVAVVVAEGEAARVSVSGTTAVADVVTV